MVPADALSRRHDHAKGIEVSEDILGLLEELFIRLVNLDLQDAVVIRDCHGYPWVSRELPVPVPVETPTRTRVGWGFTCGFLT